MYEKFKDFQLSILGVLIALALISVAFIVSDNLSKDNISVTGSSFEIVKSDTAAWTLRIETKAPTRIAAYKTIKEQLPLVQKYLLDNGIESAQIDIAPTNSYETYKTNPTTGYSTNEIAYYNFNQTIKVTSDDVEKIKQLSTDVQSLLEKGITISSDMPEYQYSKLADLKVKLLASAATDAKARAKSMLKSNHNTIGKIRSAKMGVFQITPPDSNSVSDMGINDLSTIDKKVTAVANVVFAIK